MAKTTLSFSGPCRWAKVYRADEKYAKYGVELQMTMEDFEKFKSFKVRNGGKPENGKMWVSLGR